MMLQCGLSGCLVVCVTVVVVNLSYPRADQAHGV